MFSRWYRYWQDLPSSSNICYITLILIDIYKPNSGHRYLIFIINNNIIELILYLYKRSICILNLLLSLLMDIDFI